MKMMKEEMPKFLEDKAEELKIEELERYNNQLDVIEEICQKFENDPNDQEGIVNLLYKLQEHGAPPEEMLNKIQQEHAPNSERRVSCGLRYPDMRTLRGGRCAGLLGTQPSPDRRDVLRAQRRPLAGLERI